MIKKIIFKDIIFNNFDHQNFKKIITKKGLFVFPSGPGLGSINSSKEYFINSFNAYKYDTRENYIMRIIAKGYTEKQIIAMSNYFHKQNPLNVK